MPCTMPPVISNSAGSVICSRIFRPAPPALGELGRTHKSISDILDFGPGKIIELNRIAGEPIDVLVNGKFVAKGEVVVIEESFGVRITEIINNTPLGTAVK